MDTTFIYALKDPDTGSIRYIGKTDNPKTRLPRHMKDGIIEKNHRANWINSLIAKGQKPVLEVIDEVPFEYWPSCECAYIEYFLESGCALTNATPGGEGVPKGTRHTQEARAKISAATSGEKHPMFGKKHTPEACEKISAAQKGKKLSPERCAKRRIKKQKASSNFYGVSWENTRGKWRSQISTLGKKTILGRFTEEAEAAEVYDIAAKIHHGVHAKLNFPG